MQSNSHQSTVIRHKFTFCNYSRHVPRQNRLKVSDYPRFVPVPVLILELPFASFDNRSLWFIMFLDAIGIVNTLKYLVTLQLMHWLIIYKVNWKMLSIRELMYSGSLLIDCLTKYSRKVYAVKPLCNIYYRKHILPNTCDICLTLLFI